MNAILSRPATYRQPGVSFDAEGHRYFHYGSRVPNVTGVLKAMHQSASFGHVAADVLEDKRDIGHLAHHVTHLHDLGTPEGELDVDVRGYFTAWRLFCDEMQFEPILMETPLVHQAFNYAGTLDRWGIAHKLDPFPVVVDLKTGDPDDAAAHQQTAAYDAALRANIRDIYQWLEELREGALPWSLPELEGWMNGNPPRYSVQLKPTGRYAVHVYERGFEDFGKFRAALTAYVNRHPSWREP